MTLLWRGLGVVVALLATLGIVFLTDAPSLVEPSSDGMLRLSWRTVGERIESCRPPTEADLAALPLHMRPKEICEGRLASFELRLRVDGQLLVERTVRPAGLREDRPIYVFEEQRVRPGRRHIEVDFLRLGEDPDDLVTVLELASEVEVSRRGVVLVTLDRETGELVLRQEVFGG